MCGIAITRASKLRPTLLNQKDRGLDSVGVLTEDNIYRLVRNNYRGYKKYLKNIKDDGAVILHHRKATVGAINIENSHPFLGKKFYLMQNGTARGFYEAYKDVHKADTDTETLLKYIESRTSKLEDIPNILDTLSITIGDSFGVIIIRDLKDDRILFYADGARETYLDLDLENNKVNSLTNYPEGKIYGFENVGHLIMDFDFNILENTFIEINNTAFSYGYSNTSTTSTNTITSNYYSDYDNGYYEYLSDEGRHRSSYYSPARDYGKPKTFDDLTSDEQLEHPYLKMFLEENWQSMIYFSKEKVLSEYLEYSYGITTTAEYYKQYDCAFPYRVFTMLYEDIFGL